MREEEIKVGEYIRTKSGNIGKVLDITNVTMQKRKKYLIKWNISKAYYITATTIVKHSPNIIDLIEVGDYVNGIKIISIIEQADIKKHIELCGFDNDYLNIKFDEIDIKDIVTKEQFNQVKYEV